LIEQEKTLQTKTFGVKIKSLQDHDTPFCFTNKLNN